MRTTRPVYSAAPTATPPLFTTTNRSIAAYLTCRLRYCGARLSADRLGAAEFLFEDPEAIGHQLVGEYNTRSAVPQQPRTLFEAWSFLRSEGERVRTGVGNGTHR